ncbi:MAG: hypothetical protein LBI35_02605 [Burkholderiales bacterium]|jgi:hypothetical protein|nr:hypothetical protein [Burkholderiales bacterium]
MVKKAFLVLERSFLDNEIVEPGTIVYLDESEKAGRNLQPISEKEVEDGEVEGQDGRQGQGPQGVPVAQGSEVRDQGSETAPSPPAPLTQAGEGNGLPEGEGTVPAEVATPVGVAGKLLNAVKGTKAK